MGNKRANTNSQQRREDFEYEDSRESEGGPPTQEDPGEGFTRASDDVLKKRKIVSLSGRKLKKSGNQNVTTAAKGSIFGNVNLQPSSSSSSSNPFGTVNLSAGSNPNPNPFGTVNLKSTNSSSSSSSETEKALPVWSSNAPPAPPPSVADPSSSSSSSSASPGKVRKELRPPAKVEHRNTCTLD